MSVFDGTTHVNLQVVASQLPSLTLPDDEPGELDTEDGEQVPLGELFSRTRQTWWNPLRPGLRLTNGGRDEITQSWPSAQRQPSHGCALWPTAA